MKGIAEYLNGLEWNDFSTYPKQETDIYLHVSAYCPEQEKETHHLLHLRKFNAVTFDPARIVSVFDENLKWHLEWLPLKETNEKYHKLMNAMSDNQTTE